MDPVTPETLRIHRGSTPLDLEGFIRGRYELTLACAEVRQEHIDEQRDPDPRPVPSILPNWFLWLETGFNNFRNRTSPDLQSACFALRCHAIMNAMRYASVIANKELVTLEDVEHIVTIFGLAIGRLTLTNVEDIDTDAQFCSSKYAILDEQCEHMRPQVRVIWEIVNVNTWFCNCLQCTAHNAIFNLKLDTCYCLRCRKCKSALECHRCEE